MVELRETIFVCGSNILNFSKSIQCVRDLLMLANFSVITDLSLLKFLKISFTRIYLNHKMKRL